MSGSKVMDTKHSFDVRLYVMPAVRYLKHEFLTGPLFCTVCILPKCHRQLLGLWLPNMVV